MFSSVNAVSNQGVTWVQYVIQKIVKTIICIGFVNFRMLNAFRYNLALPLACECSQQPQLAKTIPTIVVPLLSRQVLQRKLSHL